MSWVSGIVVFLLVWWMVLFMVLPWGIRTADKPKDGTAYGAPINPNLWKRAIITTLISVPIWVLIYLVVESDLISFRHPDPWGLSQSRTETGE